jgi:hypothetical protein
MSDFKDKCHRSEGRDGLDVSKNLNGLYEATATPPHVKSTWSTTQPMFAPRLIGELKARGCHQKDIGEPQY